jgi:hypothetical protein
MDKSNLSVWEKSMELTRILRERAQKLTADAAALYLALKRKDAPLLAEAIIGITVWQCTAAH